MLKSLRKHVFLYVLMYVCFQTPRRLLDGYTSFLLQIWTQVHSLLEFIFKNFYSISIKTSFDWKHCKDLEKTVIFIKQFLCVLVFFFFTKFWLTLLLQYYNISSALASIKDVIILFLWMLWGPMFMQFLCVYDARIHIQCILHFDNRMANAILHSHMMIGGKISTI